MANCIGFLSTSASAFEVWIFQRLREFKSRRMGCRQLCQFAWEDFADILLVSSEHNKFLLKGCIREFSHGVGLDHIGPKPELRLGNTLMGPIQRSMSGKKDSKTMGCLSEANAAILSVHPIFSGNVKNHSADPIGQSSNRGGL